MSDPLSGKRAELTAAYERRLAQIRELQKRAGQVTATARSRNGLISVTVGASGQLLDLKLDPGVYNSLPPQRLAAAVKELAKKAAADAAEQVQEVMEPVLPPGGMPAD